MNQPTPITVIFPAFGRKPNSNVRSANASYRASSDGERIKSRITNTAKNGRIFMNRLL